MLDDVDGMGDGLQEEVDLLRVHLLSLLDISRKQMCWVGGKLSLANQSLEFIGAQLVIFHNIDKVILEHVLDDR